MKIPTLKTPIQTVKIFTIPTGNNTIVPRGIYLYSTKLYHMLHQITAGPNRHRRSPHTVPSSVHIIAVVATCLDEDQYSYTNTNPAPSLVLRNRITTLTTVLNLPVLRAYTHNQSDHSHSALPPSHFLQLPPQNCRTPTIVQCSTQRTGESARTLPTSTWRTSSKQNWSTV